MSPMRLTAAVFVLAAALAGCSHECTRNSDCASKGSDYVCYLSTCQEKVSSLSPDAGACSPVCSGATPACDSSGSKPVCVQCTADDKSACTGATPACDTSQHICVTCATNADCTDPSKPVCDTSVAGGQCVVCTGSNVGACAATGQICDAANNRCITCASDNDCTDPATPVCDTAVDGGSCVQCDATNSSHCAAPSKICNTDGSAGQTPDTCVVCRNDADCGGLHCDTTVPGGQCTCSSSTDCQTYTPTTPTCDLANHTCVLCDANVACTDPTKPQCDIPQGQIGGSCVECLGNADCAGNASGSLCDTQATSPTANTCVQCVNGGSCSYTQDCVPVGDPARTCQAVDVATADGQIAAVRNAFLADGGATSLGSPLTMNNGIVTYAHGAVGGDSSGFFVQAVPTTTPTNSANAIFVLADAGTVQVGDRVQLTVNAIATTSGGVKEVSSFSGLSVVNSGHDVSALSADVSGVDLSNPSTQYESALVSFAGTLGADAGIAGSGNGFDQIRLDDTGATGNASQVFRFSVDSQLANDTEPGCTVTATNIPGWRFKLTAEATAYAATDYTATNCPGPKLVSATDSDTNTLQIFFDRTIDPATVSLSSISFPFDSITAQSVSVSGRVITVVTSAQTQGTTYTVEVALTVKDKAGTPLQANGTRNGNPVAEESFVGNQFPPQLVINEVNPNISGTSTTLGTGHDLVELKALKGGYLGGIQLEVNYKAPPSSVDVLATMPPINVAAGDLIVVHLNPGNTGDAAASETTAKDQYAAASFSANYDNAWDVLGATDHSYDADLSPSTDSVLLVVSTNTNTVLDAVPYVASTDGSTASSNFVAWVGYIEQLGIWGPTSCVSGCSNATAEATSVLWNDTSPAMGADKTGPSLQRVAGSSNLGHQPSDWSAKTQTWGANN